MDQTDGGGSSKPNLPPGGTDRYQKGHEGYGRWYGQPGHHAERPDKHTKHGQEEPKQPSIDHYCKGHEGYKKHYGNPGSPSGEPTTTEHMTEK